MAKTFPTESSPSPFNNEEGPYYKVVKLKTGETILCSMPKRNISITSDAYFTMEYPVLSVLTKQMLKNDDVVAEMFILRPWIGTSNSPEFIISSDIVLTVGDMLPVVRRQYLQYLREYTVAQRMIQAEADGEDMEKSIYDLLSRVNPSGNVRFVNVENPRNL